MTDNQQQFHSFNDVFSHLDRLGLFHMNFGLERMTHALQKLDLLEHTCPAVQIVGTNGKGSTSTFLSSIAIAHGLKVGLYTSPHFLTPRERIRINSEMLSEKFWPDLATHVHAVAPDLTYFEFLTAIAMLAFAEQHVDLAVLESGLGGRFDAVSATCVQLLCYTPIGMDHEKVLGRTLLAIAEDKAGAIRVQPYGSAVLAGKQEPEVMDCLIRTAQRKGVPFYGIDWQVMPFGLFDTKNQKSIPKLGMQGPHQIDNARLALSAWMLLAEKNGWKTTRQAICDGLGKAHLAGRLQSVPAAGDNPPYLLDGAHNPHGMKALAFAIKAAAIKPRAVIFSCLADKNRTEMIPLLLQLAQGAAILVPDIDAKERALDAATLAAEINASAHAFPDIQAALDAAKAISADDPAQPVLLCGSLYLLAAFFRLHPELVD